MSFEGFRLKRLNYEVKDESQEDKNNETQIKFNIGYRIPENKGKDDFGHLIVSCTVEQYRVRDMMEIEVVLDGAFKFSIQEADRIETFIKLNGTTILMPYIRNIVSMVTGYDTTENHFLLPPVNVQRLFEEQR